MIQLQRHIEILLLGHDCVIIPGFGGFIAHHVDARYDEDDRLWLPPYRTLGFNLQLTLNDSLLVQSYVEAYDMSYPDALRQIESEVEELKGVLSSEGAYEMDGVGTLHVNFEGNIEFEPCEAGILSPEVYGLADFSFKRLKDFVPLKEAAPTAEVVKQEGETPSPALLEFTDDGNDDVDHAMVIKMSWVRNAVAIAAAIACFFLMATPVANSDLGNKAMSQLQGNIIYKLMPKDSNMAPAQPVEVKEVLQPEDRSVARNKEVKEVKEVLQPEDRDVAQNKEVKEVLQPEGRNVAQNKEVLQPEGRSVARNKVADNVNAIDKKDTYCVVLASQVKRENAEIFVEQLKKRGISDARINVDNGTLRVICGSYDNQSEAYIRLNKIASDIELADAWVYKLKGV